MVSLFWKNSMSMFICYSSSWFSGCTCGPYAWRMRPCEFDDRGLLYIESIDLLLLFLLPSLVYKLLFGLAALPLAF